jgi:hypothetical protein
VIYVDMNLHLLCECGVILPYLMPHKSQLLFSTCPIKTKQEEEKKKRTKVMRLLLVIALGGGT